MAVAQEQLVSHSHPPRGQFSLRVLFWLTTVCGVVAAISTYSVWLAVSIALSLLYLVAAIAAYRVGKRIHLETYLAGAAAIGLICICYNIMTSLGGGISSIDRKCVFAVCSIDIGLAAPFALLLILELDQRFKGPRFKGPM